VPLARLRTAKVVRTMVFIGSLYLRSIEICVASSVRGPH
jgi:hypothetical protein